MSCPFKHHTCTHISALMISLTFCFCFQGLSSLQFNENEVDDTQQTSVSLVSNGAECVMLSKKFFIDHANMDTRNQLRKRVRPYPSEEALQENLQIKVDWDLYKRKLIDDMINNRSLHT